MRMCELSVKDGLARFAYDGAELGGDRAAQPIPRSAPRRAEWGPDPSAPGDPVTAEAALAFAALPHHGEIVQPKIRLERERIERDAGPREVDR
jgi:hypothetical protein